MIRLQGCGLFAASLFVGSLAFAGVTEYRSMSIGRPKHFADTEDLAKVRQGKQIYQSRCAACHGRNLQGQPLWQMKDENLGRRAPALDQTGRAWTLSDDDLFAAASHTHLWPGRDAEDRRKLVVAARLPDRGTTFQNQ